MEAIRAQHLAINLMTQHGLIQAGWKFNFSSAVKRFGVCKHNSKRIELSLPITKLNDEVHVKDTILHEIAHALVGRGHGHDLVWQKKCIEIGAKPERCYSTDQVTQPQMKYHATCGGCGKVHQKARIVDKTASRACKCQGGKPWDKKILLNFVARY